MAFMPDLHFAHVFFVHFAPHIIPSGRDGEQFAAVAHEFAVDRFDVGKDALHRSADFSVLHLRFDFLGGGPQRFEVAIALNLFRLERRPQAVYFTFRFLVLDRGDVTQGRQLLLPLHIAFRDLERLGGG